MKLVKVNDLNYNSLCYSVCMIETPDLVWGETIGIHHASSQVVVPGRKSQPYSPFMNWDEAGEILEKHIGNLWKNNKFNQEAPDVWTAAIYSKTSWENIIYTMDGPTALIACIKAYVCYKKGNEVEIPEELL